MAGGSLVYNPVMCRLCYSEDMAYHQSYPFWLGPFAAFFGSSVLRFLFFGLGAFGANFLHVSVLFAVVTLWASAFELSPGHHCLVSA